MGDNKIIYSVFYSAGRGGFFQSKTDFEDFDMANEFIGSELFTTGGYKFDFMLENGKKLLSGIPIENNVEFFSKAMLYAIDVPLKDYLE